MVISGGERQQRNRGIESKIRVTHSSSMIYPSSFASQSSSFGGGGEGDNSFGAGVGVGAGVRGGGEGGGLSEILRAIQLF